MDVFEFVLALVVLIMLFVVILAKLGVQRRSAGYGDEDTLFMQNLNSNLLRMEKRIESLETILMDRIEAPPALPRELAGREF